MPEAIQIELICCYPNNFLAGYFCIVKTQKLLTKKYYWPTLRHNIEAYVKGSDVCLVSKMVKHKLYGNLQSLPVSTHQWKDLLMKFVTGFLISTNKKRGRYDFILVIVDQLTKMIHYEPVKITINALSLVELIINVVV